MPKRILITGANRGIGLEMTRQATARGDTVIACTRNALESPDLVALAKQHDAITVLGLDVTAETDMKQIAAGMLIPPCSSNQIATGRKSRDCSNGANEA